MATLQEILQGIVPTQRYIYTGDNKPSQYCTYQHITSTSAVCADDEEVDAQIMYRVTLFSKTDYESVLGMIIKALKASEYYINSTDGESYETDTGYWKVPITIQILKE